MAFNTTADHGQTATDIITEALELCGVLEEGEAPSAAQTTSALRTLNNLIKLWQADTQIFAQGEFQLDLVAGQDYYQLTTTTTDRETDTLGYIPTKVLNANLIATAWQESASLTVPYDTLVGTFTAGERVTFSGGSGGYVVTDNATDSMTVAMDLNETNPANDETITGSDSGATAAVNGTVTETDRTGDNTEIPMTPLTQQEWYALTDKSTQSRPTQYYAKRNPVGVALDFYVWPVPENTDYDMKLWLQYPYRDVDAGTDDVWFTQEWYLALSYMMAYLLGPKYGIDPRERNDFKAAADEFYAVAASYDTDGSVFLQPGNKNG